LAEHRALSSAPSPPDDQGSGEKCRFVRIKSNIGTSGGGFEYELRLKPVGDQQPPILGQYVYWGNQLNGSPRALLGEVEGKDDDDTSGKRLREAKDFLRDILKSGPVEVKVAYRLADKADVTQATLRRAKDLLNIQSAKCGFDGIRNGIGAFLKIR
jgi:hypothetical protein